MHSTENLEGVEKIEITVHILIWKEGVACCMNKANCSIECNIMEELYQLLTVAILGD